LRTAAPEFRVTRAIILAAGRGERLRPLTDHLPKPLLRVRHRPLIEWHLHALSRAGVREVVINTAWLEDRFPAVLGDGSRFRLAIHYSTEGRDHGGALETAGGIAKALPLLGEAFWVVAGDVFVPGFEFDAATAQRFAAGNDLGHLWLVPNPPHHPQGDFGIAPGGRALREAAERFTWASVGLFRAEMFAGIAPGTRLALRPLLEQAIDAGRLGAELWRGDWADVGTAERLAALNGA
jgi:MurNAc alpha-1-phosphate uridylyltransferase